MAGMSNGALRRAGNPADRTLEVLTAAAGGAGAAARPGVWAPGDMPFRGRDTELAELDAALAAAGTSRGSLYLIAGEPGIGKTRLTDEVAQRAAARGMTVLRGRCWEGGGAPAYWPWIQLLRAHLAQGPRHGELRAAAKELLHDVAPKRPGGGDDARSKDADGDAGRFQLLDALVSFFHAAAAASPQLLIVEDLHAADEPSLATLQLLAGTLRDAPIVVIASYRDVEARRSPAVARRLAELNRDGRSVMLGGLDHDAVAALLSERFGVQAAGGLVAAVHDATGGNPFFIEQVVPLLPDVESATTTVAVPVPDQVREAIRWRLEPVAQPVRQLLEIAAVVGRDIDVALVARVGGLAPEAAVGLLDDAVAAGLVAVRHGGTRRLEFVHSLVRETLYDDLPSARRLSLHRRIGEVLGERLADGDESRVAETAHHYVAAAALGDVEPAITACRRAGARAMRVYAYEDAARLYGCALELLDQRGTAPADRCRALLDLGDAQRGAGDAAAARATFVAAADAASEVGSGEQLALAALGYALGHGGYGFVDRADDVLIGMLERALAGLAADDSVLRVRLLARLAVELYYTVAAERRDALSAEAVAMAERLGDERALLVARYSRHWCRLGPDDPDARAEVAGELVALALRVGDLEMTLRGYHLQLTTALELGDVVAVDAALEHYARVAERLRQPFARWHLQTLRAMRAFVAGDMAECERLAFDALEIGQRAQGDTAALLFGVQLCTLRWAQGRIGEIEPAIRLFVERYPWSAWRSALVVASAEAGRVEETRALFERTAAEDFRNVPRDGNWLTMLCQLAVPCVRLGDARRAETLYRLLEPYADRIVVANAAAVCYGSTHTYLGLLAATAGRSDDADRHLEAGLFDNLALGHRPLATWTLLEHAVVLARRGERERADAMLGEATVWARETGMDAAAAAAAQRSGESTAAQEPTAPAAPKRVFRREGDYWTVVFDGRVSRLRDGKGPRYLAHLLRNPHQRIAALDLVAQGGPAGSGRLSPGDAADLSSDGTGGAGPLLDAQAKAAYKRRIRDLQSELDEAQAFNDTGRAAAIEREMDAILGELRRAVGLGGRDRVAASPAERARVSVTKVVKQTIRRLGEQEPRLASHLESTVHTGTFCAYVPDPDTAVLWEG